MRWLVAVLAVLGGLLGAALGACLVWLSFRALSPVVLATWSGDVPPATDPSVVWFWRGRMYRLASMGALAATALGAGLWGARLAVRADGRAGRVLAAPVLALVLVALPDPLMLELSLRIGVVLGIAAGIALVALPRRGFGWAAAVVLALAAGAVLPNVIRHHFLDEVRAGDSRAVRGWIAAGVDPTDPAGHGQWEVRPLIVAVEAGQAEMAALLVRATASPYTTDRRGRSAMMLSIERGSTPVTEGMLRVLLERGDRDPAPEGTD